jgi:hypothetical protein
MVGFDPDHSDFAARVTEKLRQVLDLGSIKWAPMTDNELLQVIERAAKEDLQSLNLSFNQLSSLPPEIVRLTSLQLSLCT